MLTKENREQGGSAGMSSTAATSTWLPQGRLGALQGPPGRQGWVSRCWQAVGIAVRQEDELGRWEVSQIQMGCYHGGNSSPPSAWTQAGGSASPDRLGAWMGTHHLLPVPLEHTFPLGLTGL